MSLPTDIVFEDIRTERDQYTENRYGVDHLISAVRVRIWRSDQMVTNTADRRTDLVKAAAMLAAAIELMDRAESSDGE